MKGNSVRLRLGQSEVKRLAIEGIVEESTAFGPSTDHRFVYTICALPEQQGVSASFTDGRLVICVPTSEILQWATTDQVGIDALQQNGDGTELRIVIEKDFECMEARARESQEDAFPHPQFNTACPAEK
jgi:hypothetical protein